MKKSKILMPIIGIAAIGSSIAPLTTLTSCNKGSFNVVSLAEGSTQAKEIGFKASYAYYNFKQENGKEAESTKVKIAKLIANDAEVTPVSGLVKSSTDSAGNISVKFNLATFKTQYQATKASFDLLFVNEKAGTSYTLTGFSAYFSETEEVKEEDYWKMYDERYNEYGKRAAVSEWKGDYTKVTLDTNDWFWADMSAAGIPSQKVYLSQFTETKTTIRYGDLIGAGFIAGIATLDGKFKIGETEYSMINAVSTMVGGIPTPLMQSVVVAQVIQLVKSKEGEVETKYYMDANGNLGLRISGGNKIYFDGAVNTNCHIVYQNIPQETIKITYSGITLALFQAEFHFNYSK